MTEAPYVRVLLDFTREDEEIEVFDLHQSGATRVVARFP